jgi:hypothetical protein
MDEILTTFYDYSRNLRSRINTYSISGVDKHHATIVNFIDLRYPNGKEVVVRIELIGDVNERNLQIHMTDDVWNPERARAPVYQLPQSYKLEDLRKHAREVSCNFGSYRHKTNNCQDWNNAFLNKLKVPANWTPMSAGTTTIGVGVALSASGCTIV